MAELKCAQCHYYYIVFLISDHYTILSSMFENYDNSCLKSITLLRVSYSKVKLDWPTKRGMEAHTLPIQDKNGFQLPKTSIENYICLGYRIFQTFCLVFFGHPLLCQQIRGMWGVLACADNDADL